MVDPISDAERSAFYRRMRYGLTLLVGASGGLTALRVETTLPLTAGAVAVGLAVGYVLAWFIIPSGAGPTPTGPDRTSRVENPFADGGDQPRNDSHEADDDRSRERDRGRR